MLNGGTIQRVVFKDGTVIEAPQNNTLIEMAREIFIREVYMPKGWFIGKDDVVIDIGANIGIFSLYAALKTENRVYAFEPFPENVTWLTQNLKANNVLERVAVNCVAVSDTNETERLYISEISGGHLLFDHNIKGPLNDSIKVPSKTLESILEENAIEQVDFLKIDCEGSEGQILQAARASGLETVRKIAMEFHDNVSCIQRLSATLGFKGFGRCFKI